MAQTPALTLAWLISSWALAIGGAAAPLGGGGSPLGGQPAEPTLRCSGPEYGVDDVRGWGRRRRWAGTTQHGRGGECAWLL